MHSLIIKIKIAVEKGQLNRVFTTRDVIDWMRGYCITKPDGFEYSPISVNSLLSKSSVHNLGSSSTNSKMLDSYIIDGRKRVYFFIR